MLARPRKQSASSFVGSELRSMQETETDDDQYYRAQKGQKASPEISPGKSSMQSASDEQQAQGSGKLSSIMIVFNTWNAMIGCGTVTIPWAFQQSGVLLGVFLTAFACVLAFTTNYLILRVAGADTNFSDTMHRYFPKYGWSVSMACFIINFYVALILFFQVLSQSLYPILLFVMGQDVEIEMKTDWSQFSLSYTCLILLGIVLLMVLPRNTSYIQKVNAFGVVFICIFLGFIIMTGVRQMATTEYIYSVEAFNEAKSSNDPVVEKEYHAYIPLINSQFTPLMGILGGGYYFHNMSLSMLHNAEKPQDNVRNIAIGFFLVFCTYSLIGVLGVYGFTGEAFAAFEPSVNMIKENCLNMFASDNGMATFIRACILCQLLCVNTLLFGLLRSQILLLYKGITEGQGAVGSEADIKLDRCKNFGLSFLMTLPPIALAIWYPYVGKLGALIAAFSTMFVIFVLPLATYAKAVYEEQKDIAPLRMDRDDDFERILGPDSDYSTAKQTKVIEINNEKDEMIFRKLRFDSDEESPRDSMQKKSSMLTSWSFHKVALASAMLATYGITVFVIQLFYLA